MQISRFRIYKALIAVGLAVAVGIAIVTGAAIIALAAVIAAIALAFVVERSNKEIVRDERISLISGKAASVSFMVMLMVAAAASLVTALFRSQLPETIVFAGSIMGCYVCLALLLQMCLYAFFSRKL
jgi:uncharacterized membrane protein